MRRPRRSVPREWPLVLAIALGATLLACIWATRLPVFKPPDERVHADYAFVLYNAGRPFRIDRARGSYEPVSNQVRYLSERVGYRALRYNAYARVAPGYGSREFRVALDENAPPKNVIDTAPGSPLPYVSFAYPCGYYATIAVVLWLADHLTDSLWWDFMLARYFNAALLLVTLPLAYGALRESGARPRAALAATAAIAFFPLVSWVGAYVQPDNLSLLLVTLAVYLGLRLRAQPERSVVPLSLTLGALFFVKLHYAVAVFVPALLLIATRGYASRSRALTNAAWLAIVAGAAFALSLQATPAHNVAVASMLHSAGKDRLGLLLEGFADEFLGGSGFKDYWIYDMRDFTVGGIHVAGAFLTPAIFGTLVLLGLTSAATVRSLWRIARVAAHRSTSTALRLFGSGIALHVYLAVTAVVLWAYVLSGGALWLEGRYWLPVIVPLAVVLVTVLPKSLRAGRREGPSEIVAFAMLAVSALTAPLMFAAMENDYYRPPGSRPTVDRMAMIEFVSADGRRYRPSADIRILKNAGGLVLAGHAVDPVSGGAATRILVNVDARRSVTAHDDEASPQVAIAYNDAALERAGFRVRVPTRNLGAGRHLITLYVETSAGGILRFGNDVAFTLAPG